MLPPWAESFFGQRSRYRVAHGGRGSAKCLGLGTPVLMFDGSVKPVEEIVVGDLVMGPDSTQRVVLATTRGESELYRVKQTSAIDYVVNEDHILSLKKSESCQRDVGEISKAGNARRPDGRYPSWPIITNIGIKEYLKQSKRWRDNFRGYRAGLINFSEQEVPVDPYLLGLWLGDGLHRELMITNADQEIVEWLRQFSERNDVGFSMFKKPGQKAYDIRMPRDSKKYGRSHPIWNGFRSLGVVCNKHVPSSYIANSENIRLKLLAGIIDSDGHLQKCAYYCVAQKNEKLAHGIKLLADTLGFRTSITKVNTICSNNGKSGSAWRISIGGDLWRIPCLVKRKRVGIAEMRPNKDKMLSYVSVDPIGRGEYAGFSVDKDHLFCLGDGTVTHNSWTFARRLLLMAAERPLRVLCARELQISIKDSVHRLLSDQVHALGLSDKFDVGQKYLRGLNGSEFIFKGLRHNVNEIKSTEGVDLCWVEEAQAVSEESWALLIPTIRAPGSEIWVTFNPDQATDPTYKRFVVRPPDNAVVLAVNYDQNPWFPPDLELERSYLARVDPDAYAHVWLGKCRAYTDAQVLKGKWIIDVFEPGPDWHGPYYGADWGFAQDPTALVKCWVHERKLYVEHEAWGVEVSLDNTPMLFDRVPDARQSLVRADSARPETINHLRERGYVGMTAVHKWQGSVEDGVEFLRSFEKIVIHERCKHVADEARLWSFKTDRLTGDVLPALKSGNDNCWDAVRYALEPMIRQRKSALYLFEEGRMNEEQERMATSLPGISSEVLQKIGDVPDGACGGCSAYSAGWCSERHMRVGATDPGCVIFDARRLAA